MKKSSKMNAKQLKKKAKAGSQKVMAAAGGVPGNGMTIKSYKTRGSNAYPKAGGDY